MTVASERASNFVRHYTELLTTCWSDEEFAEDLIEDPERVMRSIGFPVPPGTRIHVVQSSADGEGDLDHQLRLWEDGLESGHVTLHVPSPPELMTQTIDLDDLAGVGGGMSCCCCAPCSCCTA